MSYIRISRSQVYRVCHPYCACMTICIYIAVCSTCLHARIVIDKYFSKCPYATIATVNTLYTHCIYCFYIYSHICRYSTVWLNECVLSRSCVRLSAHSKWVLIWCDMWQFSHTRINNRRACSCTPRGGRCEQTLLAHPHVEWHPLTKWLIIRTEVGRLPHIDGTHMFTNITHFDTTERVCLYACVCDCVCLRVLNI